MVHNHFFKEGVFQQPKEHEEHLAHLKDWMSSQPHLPQISDEHLSLFLHSCESDRQLTKATIEKYYTLRTHCTEMFGNRDPMDPHVQAILNIVHLVPITRVTPEGYKVALYRLVDYNPDKYSFVPSLKLFNMFNDMRLAEDGLIPGYIVVFDMKGVSLGHLPKVSITAIRKFMIYIQECLPVRLKAIHVINTVTFIDKVLLLVKPFMKSSLVDLLHFHGPVESLEKYFPLDILPEEYGGKSESCAQNHAKQRALMEKDYVDWYREEETLRVDESKRKGKKNMEANSYSVEGSFRTLAID